MSTTQQRHDTTTQRPQRAHGMETRPARHPTGLVAYLAAVLAVAVTAFVVGHDGENTADTFRAEHALRSITFLTIGSLIPRGRLATVLALVQRAVMAVVGRRAGRQT